MKPSQNFFDLVEAFEGCKLAAYKDVAGVWTIGYGTIQYPNGDSVQQGDTCTREQAVAYLADHIAGIQLPSEFTQQQYDSCLDFCYNVGTGAWASSSLKKAILSGESDETIAMDFCMWDKAHVNGALVVVPGLLRRRKCEAYLCANGVNEPSFFEND